MYHTSHVTTKVLILYRRHDSDDKVWCYRRTEETLTLLEASPGEPRVEMREHKRERREIQRGFKKETTKVKERRQEEKVWRWIRQWHPLRSFGHLQTIWCYTSADVLQIRTCLRANSKCLLGGGVGLLLKLWDETWNCSCMLQSIPLSSLCQRLDCLSLSPNEAQDRCTIKNWIKSC